MITFFLADGMWQIFLGGMVAGTGIGLCLAFPFARWMK